MAVALSPHLKSWVRAWAIDNRPRVRTRRRFFWRRVGIYFFRENCRETFFWEPEYIFE